MSNRVVNPYLKKPPMTLTQMDFFEDTATAAATNQNTVTPDTNQAKKRRTNKEEDDGELELVERTCSFPAARSLFTLEDPTGVGQLTMIAGYTNHWFEEEYIQMLHNNLIHKIRKLQDN